MKVTKMNAITEETRNYGSGYTEKDVKAMTTGYKFNGLFYERANSPWIIVVEED